MATKVEKLSPASEPTSPVLSPMSPVSRTVPIIKDPESLGDNVVIPGIHVASGDGLFMTSMGNLNLSGGSYTDADSKASIDSPDEDEDEDGTSSWENMPSNRTSDPSASPLTLKGDDGRFSEDALQHFREYIKLSVNKGIISKQQGYMLMAGLCEDSPDQMSPVSQEGKSLYDIIKRLRSRDGVKVGVRRKGFRHYHGVFDGKAAVTWLVERGLADSRQHAVEIGRRLLDHGYIVHVKGKRHFEDKEKFYRFSDVMLRQGPDNHVMCASGHAVFNRLVYHVHENSIDQWIKNATMEDLLVGSPVALLWCLNRLSTQSSFRHHGDSTQPAGRQLTGASSDSNGSNGTGGSSPAHPGHHPTLRHSITGTHSTIGDGGSGVQSLVGAAILRQLIAKMREEDKLRFQLYGFAQSNRLNTPDPIVLAPEQQRTVDLVSNGPPGKYVAALANHREQYSHPLTGAVASEVKLMKVFTSDLKPSWLRFLDADGAPIVPDVVAKVGDDLRKDFAVQLFFRACEAVWASSDAEWKLGVPYVRTYQVRPLGPTAGFLEFLPGQTVKVVEQETRWEGVDLLKLSPSAVGSYVSAFVLGVRDRHSENWMLVGDPVENPELVQIDFGYLLMENPGGFPLDTPRLTMQPSLVKRYESAAGVTPHSTLMEDLQFDMLQAFAVLRQHQYALISLAKILLSQAYDPDRVQMFMMGNHVFQTSKTEKEALEWFEDKLHSQLTRTVVRRGAKAGLVKFYYAVRKVL